MSGAIRWSVLGAVVAVCAGYLAYSASSSSSEYYLTVSELLLHPPSSEVRVAGVVQDDVARSDGGLHVSFTERDGTASLPVEYTGTLPDIFKPGITVVAQGRLGSDGVFHASQVLAKCPSRFATTPYTQ